MEEVIAIERPFDGHLHLRNDPILLRILPYTAGVFSWALVMPNTKPPILTAEDASRYRAEIIKNRGGYLNFLPLMSIQITPATTPEIIRRAREDGVVAGKLYPEGVTTGSENGVRDFNALDGVFAEMEKAGMVLSLHGEMPGVFCLDREVKFLEALSVITNRFPRLKVVLEHITTKAAVEFIKNAPSLVAATITVHHLYLTLDNVIGGLLNPHDFCKPIAKRPEDRDALIEAATSGIDKFFFGSDSTPHPRIYKECSEGRAGVFTAPAALPLLAEIFEKQNALGLLESFTSRYGAKFYGLPLLNNGKIKLVRKPMVIPLECHGIVPFLADRKIPWSISL